MHDVVIVGAGAAGLYTASQLEDGADILIIEEHSSVGSKACSGLFSRNLERFLEVKSEWIENKVSGVILHSPSNVEVILKKGSHVAYIINREKFDKYLASKLNIRPVYNTKALSFAIHKDKISIITNNGTFDAKIMIAADGVNSIARKFGARPREIVNSIIAIADEPNTSDFVELWLNKAFVRDGFLWKIPRGKTTEYGMLGSNAKFDILEHFFKINNYRKMAASIPIGPVKTYFERAILIGDATGITKPWSGGGVIYGLQCAKIAASVVLEALEKNRFDEQFLKRYENRWKKAIGRQIDRGLLLREIYKEMENRDIDRLFKKISDRKDLSRLDMDFPFS